MKSLLRLVTLAAALVSLSSFGMKEEWYWEFNLGPATNSYTNLGGTGSSSGGRMGGSSGIGFYFPTGTEGLTVIGPAVVAASNHFNTPKASHSMLSFSLYHFFGIEPGEGFFLRGDVGMGNITYDLFNGSSGFGFLAGAGYGFAVSDQTRFTIQARLHSVITSGAKAHTFSIVFGPMF